MPSRGNWRVCVYVSGWDGGGERGEVPWWRRCAWADRYSTRAILLGFGLIWFEYVCISRGNGLCFVLCCIHIYIYKLRYGYVVIDATIGGGVVPRKTWACECVRRNNYSLCFCVWVKAVSSGMSECLILVPSAFERLNVADFNDDLRWSLVREMGQNLPPPPHLP